MMRVLWFTVVIGHINLLKSIAITFFHNHASCTEQTDNFVSGLQLRLKGRRINREFISQPVAVVNKVLSF